jgi:hypothetical protein
MKVLQTSDFRGLRIGEVKKQKKKLVKMVLAGSREVPSTHLGVIQLCKARKYQMIGAFSEFGRSVDNS